jgi:hypothetical protein
VERLGGVAREPVCLAEVVEKRRIILIMLFAGKLLWQREKWCQRLLHNETAFQVERRLQMEGRAIDRHPAPRPRAAQPMTDEPARPVAPCGEQTSLYLQRRAADC